MDRAELFGAGASLLLFGAMVGMCVWCPRLGTRRSKQVFYEQRYLSEGGQSFTVVQTFSTPMESEGAEYSTIQFPEKRKDKCLYSVAREEDPDNPRYQNLRKGSRRESEPAYVDPIATNYYNFGQFQKQQKDDDDDASSYENILICKISEEEGKAFQEAADVEDSGDYQNSSSIQQWRESIKVERSPEDDCSEPDYVNGEVAFMK